MKERKLRGFVLPTIYLMVIGVLFVTISFLGASFQNGLDAYADEDLAVSAIKEDNVVSVIKEENDTKKIVKPFTSDKVTISKSFYDMADDEKTQQNSLVYYEKTYLQNSGVLYKATEVFDVVSVYDGTVTNVASDEILGKYIEVTHNPNLKTIYYSLGETQVSKGDTITSGQVIGKSGDNLLNNESENSLLLEVYHNGFAIDPEEFYNMNIDDLG